MTSTYTKVDTFTRSNARYVVSKVAADLKLCQRFYGKPCDPQIDDYITELVELLVGGYIDRITYGFRRDDGWVMAFRYAARTDGTLDGDERAGQVPSQIDIKGAVWGSFLVYSSKWTSLDPEERARVEDRIPIRRRAGNEPATVNGYWTEDKAYSTNGSGLRRATFKRL